jgi:hypothetical protein
MATRISRAMPTQTARMAHKARLSMKRSFRFLPIR